MPRLRRHLLHGAVLAGLVLPLGWAAPVWAADQAPVPAGAAARPDDGRADTASEALDQAEATLQGEGGLDPTLALVQVQQTKEDLSGSDRERADGLLARPDDSASPPGEINYDGRKVYSRCTTHFCIHWVRKGKHAPDLDDDNGNGRPDYVDLTAAEMERVWSKEVGSLGYRRPVGDRTKGNPTGVHRKGLVDVYLGNTGASQVYGYAVPEGQSSPSTSYLVLDNDFAEFPGSPVQSLKVTAAHEFFHTVQFAYSTTADGWFMESTATWIEEVVHDAINDNRQFVPSSTAVRPGQPLDGPVSWYGNWVFFQALSQRHGPAVVRTTWRHVAAGLNSMKAMDKALASEGTGLSDEFSRFASGSTTPGRFFDEGKHYRRSAVARTYRLGPEHRRIGKRAVRLQHMSSRNYAFKPRRNARSGARLRLRLSTRSSLTRARAVVILKGGRHKHRVLKFNASGVARTRLPFARARVKRVLLTVSNGSFRYRCFQGTAYACQGKPRDDRMKVGYRATFLP